MKVLATLWLLGLAGTATSVALAKPYYVALGMSSTALVVALSSATYVYVKVTKAARQGQRLAATEATADELDRCLAE